MAVKSAQAAAQWQGGFTAIGADGILYGYVRPPGGRTAPVVTLLLRGIVIGEAVADRFCADLCGKGPFWHGHYGFAARLYGDIAGRQSVTLSVLGHPAFALEMTIDLPALPPAPPPVTVEALMPISPRWGAADIAAHRAVLNLAACRDLMGDARLIEGLYLFALRRLPSQGETLARLAELREAWRSPEAILGELLQEPEAARLEAPFPCPYDEDYPLPVPES